MFTLIAALDQNRAIGHQGQLLFHLKADLRFFRETTSGHPVIMGRKTWDSLPQKLPHRQNIVLSHHPNSIPPKHPTLTQTGLKTPENGLKTQIAPTQPPKNGPKPPKNDPKPQFPDQIITDFPVFLQNHAADSDLYFIIGGASVYQQALPYAKTLILTEIAASAPLADAYFPPFDPNLYTKTLIKKGSENGLDFTITQYQKI